jgi:HK97 family phage major capsid protein
MRPTPADGSARAQDEVARPDYRMVFAKVICGMSPADLEPEERAVLRAGHDGRAEFRAQSTSNTAGGYTVPTTLANFIDKALKAWGPMYDEDICQVIMTSSGNPLKIPTVDDTAVVAVAHTENTALTDDGGSDVTFGQKSLDAYAFDTEFVRWSWELNDDSIFAMEQLLGDLLGERLARIANSQLTTGTGSSAPNGVVTASGLGVTAAATGAVTSDEIMDLLHSVDPAYRMGPKVRFMFNDSTLAAVRKLKDGQNNYLWQMGDVTSGVPGTLLGYRYSINQAMDSLAAAKKVMLFGDFGRYYVRKVGSPIIGVLRERFWPDNGIAGLIRFDGEIGQSGAIKHLITAAA